MRLICIHCFVSSGFKPKLLEGYKREIIRVKLLKNNNLL